MNLVCLHFLKFICYSRFEYLVFCTYAQNTRITKCNMYFAYVESVGVYCYNKVTQCNDCCSVPTWRSEARERTNPALCHSRRVTAATRRQRRVLPFVAGGRRKMEDTIRDPETGV